LNDQLLRLPVPSHLTKTVNNTNVTYKGAVGECVGGLNWQVNILMNVSAITILLLASSIFETPKV
jgi:hypothetical protein